MAQIKIFQSDTYPSEIQKVRECIWDFSENTENGTVFVTVSKEHEPKCSIKMPRPLKKEECGELYELYLRRKKGEHISGEATAATRNQVYWYGIFSDMGL